MFLIGKPSYLFLLGLFLSFCSSCQQKEISKKPNILLILTDDHGYADVGFNGSTELKTPNLDALASSGMVFSSAYVVHPFCGPSRAGLLTGRYPHKFGSQYNLPRTGEMSPGPNAGIPIEETFFTKTLQQQGYSTNAVGKWHLGKADGYHPNDRGFDNFYGFLGGGHTYFPEQYKAAYERQRSNGVESIWDYITPLEFNKKEVSSDLYLTDELSGAAIQLIKKSKSDDKPFFMYLAYNAPHVPLEAKPEDMALFPHIKDKKRKTYAGMVYAVDRGVGDIVEALRSIDELDNTLIVFLSDNGGKLEKGANNFPLKEGKGSTYEGGYRVPMFFYYPKSIPQGETFSYPVSALDLYPTFVSMAGGQTPVQKKLDGIDIWKAITTQSDPQRDEMIYALRHRDGYSDVGARQGSLKVVKTKQQKWELYDVESDPGETKDLSSEHPEIVEKMVLRAKKWSESNVQPLWFHDENTQKNWNDTDMPQFEKTFQVD